MNNIIWNKKELSKINMILLKKTNLYVDENGNLSKKKCVINNLHVSYMKYENFDKYIEEVLNFQDRNEITRLLKNAKNVDYDKNNQKHFGLISFLSNIDENDQTQLFSIINEIIALYKKNVLKVINKFNDGSVSSEEILMVTNLMKDSETKTSVEAYIEKEISSVFDYTNNLASEPLLIPLIKILNDNIKNELILRLLDIFYSKAKTEEKQRKSDMEYKKQIQSKYLKKNFNTMKKSNSKIYVSRIYNG